MDYKISVPAGNTALNIKEEVIAILLAVQELIKEPCRGNACLFNRIPGNHTRMYHRKNSRRMSD